MTARNAAARGKTMADHTDQHHGAKLWLWKNGDHYLAFDNEYPTFDGGDPMTLGEPVGWAIFTHSTPRDCPQITTTRCAAPLRGLADAVRSREAAALETAIAYLRYAAMPPGSWSTETRLEQLMRLGAREALARIAILCPDAVK
jgi:hypothetical protein